jgi:hypothetical protein
VRVKLDGECSGINAYTKFCALLVVIFFVLLSVVTITAQSVNTPMVSSGTHGTIKGTVTDISTDDPIKGTLMVLEYHDLTRKTYTDSFGQYTFNNVPICFCLKNISAHKDGYMSAYVMVGVQDVTVVDFELAPFNDPKNDGNNNSNDTDEPDEPDEPEDPYTGIVTGQVVDSKIDEPIENAFVTIEYHEDLQKDYTDSNGMYRFEGVPICFCLKNVTASKTGYESQSELIGVSSLTYLNFSLEPMKDTDDNDDNNNDNDKEPNDPEDSEEPNDPEKPDDPEDPEPKDDSSLYGTIIGYVTDKETEKPISNALVVLKYHGLVRKQITDSNGKYKFTNVPICFCLKNVSASKNGYIAEYQNVGMDKIKYVNFSLAQKPDQSKNPQINPNEPDNGDSDEKLVSDVKNKNSNYEIIHQKYSVLGILGIIVFIILGLIVMYKLKLKNTA